MLFLAVDDERLQLSRLVRCLGEACPDAEIVSFQDPREAATWLEDNRPDVSFLDIEMPEIRGTMLAKHFKTLYPDANIVFVTAFDEFAKDAFRLHASGYLRKPVDAEMIKLELEDLRYPMEEAGDKKDLEVKCFGSFEVRYKGEPLKLKRKKTLELFAYLVDRRGASVTVNDICAALWEDEEDDLNNKSYLRHLIGDLSGTLEAIGQGEVFNRNKNNYAVDVSKFSCDYYDYIEGKPYAIRAFYGQYMDRYSWAEETLASLLAKK